MAGVNKRKSPAEGEVAHGRAGHAQTRNADRHRSRPGLTPRRADIDMRGRTDRVSSIDPLGRLRSAGRRLTDPMEALAQQVAERVVGLVATALDVNALVDRVDMNALLARMDVNALLARVDLNALLARVDLDEVLRHVDMDAILDRINVNEVVERIDMDELVEHTDLG